MTIQAIQLHGPLRTAKRAEDVAAQIEAHIMELGWPAGRVLGSEKELVEKYKVSRASFREAVRLLEYHMVARMRPGPRGGLVVMKPDAEVVARSMALFLSHERAGARQLLEMRGIIEGQAAALAATTATAADHAELRGILAEEKQLGEASCRGARDFHLRIAQMGRNPVMELFVRCMISMTVKHSAPSRAGRDVAVVTRVHEIHRQICEAIIARDPELARRRMTRHIHGIDQFLDDRAAGKASKKAETTVSLHNTTPARPAQPIKRRA